MAACRALRCGSRRKHRRPHPVPPDRTSPTSRVRCPDGIDATKKRVSYRRSSNSGVIQCARAPAGRLGASARAGSTAHRSRATGPAGPPYRPPTSVPLCRRQRHETTARPAGTPTPRRSRAPLRQRPDQWRVRSQLLLQKSGGGPAQATVAAASRGSTLPPGNTYIPAAKAIVGTRRSRYASTPRRRSRAAARRGRIRASAARTTGPPPAGPGRRTSPGVRGLGASPTSAMTSTSTMTSISTGASRGGRRRQPRCAHAVRRPRTRR